MVAIFYLQCGKH